MAARVAGLVVAVVGMAVLVTAAVEMLEEAAALAVMSKMMWVVRGGGVHE